MPPALLLKGDTDVDPQAVLDGLLETFEMEAEVNTTASTSQITRDTRESSRLQPCGGRQFAAGGDPSTLRAKLGSALVCEDTNFHTFQNIEAAFRGANTTRRDRQRRNLIATARYLTAHTT